MVLRRTKTVSQRGCIWGLRAPCYSRWNGEETAKPKRQLSPAAGKQPVTYITSRYLSDIEVENTERGTGRQVVLDVGQGHNLAVTDVGRAPSNLSRLRECITRASASGIDIER